MLTGVIFGWSPGTTDHTNFRRVTVVIEKHMGRKVNQGLNWNWVGMGEGYWTPNQDTSTESDVRKEGSTFGVSGGTGDTGRFVGPGIGRKVS